jgi:hypothetical protein
MNRTAIAKRVGGALLVLALAVAAYFFAARPLFRAFVAAYEQGAASALTVVGVKASPDAAGDFLTVAFVALFGSLMIATRGRRGAK